MLFSLLPYRSLHNSRLQFNIVIAHLALANFMQKGSSSAAELSRAEWTPTARWGRLNRRFSPLNRSSILKQFQKWSSKRFSVEKIISAFSYFPIRRQRDTRKQWNQKTKDFHFASHSNVTGRKIRKKISIVICHSEEMKQLEKQRKNNIKPEMKCFFHSLGFLINC